MANIPHPNDISPEALDWAMTRSPFPYILDGLARLSRQHFGWFTKQSSRAIEYPWVLSELSQRSGKAILDIGAGVSPLPLQLAATGARVLTVDDSPLVREMGRDQAEWNEWGFLDYAALDPRIESQNRDILELDLPTASFDVIYSVSVIEHMPAAMRRKLIHRAAQWLKPRGLLLLTVDLAPGRLELWNMAAGQVVESPEQHGDLPAMENELQAAGFELRHREILREIPDSRVDCALLSLQRSEARLAAPLEKQPATDTSLCAKSPLSLWERVKMRVRGRKAQTPVMARSPDRAVSPTEGLLFPRLGPGKVVFGCTADNQPKYLSQAVRLVESLRWFGGRLADAPFVVCMVDQLDEDYRRRLAELRAEVRVVLRVSTRHAHSNKLRLLELPELRQFDTIVLLDCDTLVVQDPYPWLDGDWFQAKMADLPTIPYEVFARLFDHFGLPPASPDHRCNPGLHPTIWYCNAGVLVFPRSMLDTLAVAWQQWNERLLAQLDLLQDQKFFCDQASLSLAFAAQAAPFAELPLAMNYPLHLTAADAPLLATPCDPVIIHYHDRIDPRGYLKEALNSMAQARVECYNRRVLAERRKRFDNRLFWNFRYAHAPELGSGIGSRGETAAYKRDLLARVVKQHRPRSVLDVGCGDQHVSQVLPDTGYLGVDISSVVVERNKAANPGRRYLCGDMLDPAFQPPSADLVLCLDVLIHLDSVEAYRAFVQRLVTLTDGVGIVSGYETPPEHEHDMTFYHEPLSQTLRTAGARKLKAIGGYPQGVTVWSYAGKK